MESLGYVSEYKILNSSDFGSCQNRERLFMVSILKINN
ncbi:DNA cytosine methyltransferase [Mycoplasmopsis felis]|nr:DNA cytosine methyltransferase [Mycoplasmopsis felis]MCU9931722.1 DNA cytosine methyltransferase [Mycoplasmopsis felis]